MLVLAGRGVRVRQAVILAGGKGTRLAERLNGRPKPLIEIGGVPLLEHQILLAKRHGFTNILLLVNHAAERIVEFCEARQNWGVTVECIDDGEPLGTAGALLAILERLDDEFLVVYGDTMLGVDLTRFVSFYRALPEAGGLLFLHPNDHPQDSDLVELGPNGRVHAFHPYPHEPRRFLPNLVNAALYVLRKSALAPFRDMRSPLDCGRDLFPEMLRRGVALYGYNSPEYIKDCGTPARLDRVERDLASGKISRSSLEVPQPAVFLDRDGTINVHNGFISQPEQLSLVPGAADAVARLNRSEYRTVVITNQPVIARGDCTEHELQAIHAKLDTLLSGAGAYIDRLYYCPHHPDAGYPGEIAALKIACDCRKPARGLIEAARRDLNIATERSWMVGDTTTDMALARAAGLGAILVETGEGGHDGKFDETPDFVAADLTEAVGFIFDEYPALLDRCRGLADRVAPGEPIFIGGLSRSGKSTLAGVLRRALIERGQNANVIPLDRWLLDEADRGPDVFARYAIEDAAHAIRNALAAERPFELDLPRYDRLKRKRIAPARRITVMPQDCLIIEGTVALQVYRKLDRPGRAVFVSSDEAQRHHRVLREYRLRGCDEAAAEAIYQSRQHDEYPLVAATAGLAEQIITLPLHKTGGAAQETELDLSTS